MLPTFCPKRIGLGGEGVINLDLLKPTQDINQYKLPNYSFNKYIEFLPLDTI